MTTDNRTFIAKSIDAITWLVINLIGWPLVLLMGLIVVLIDWKKQFVIRNWYDGDEAAYDRARYKAT